MNRRLLQSGFGIVMLLGGTLILAACADDGDAVNWCSDLTSGYCDVRENSGVGAAFASGDYNGDGFIDLGKGNSNALFWQSVG